MVKEEPGIGENGSIMETSEPKESGLGFTVGRWLRRIILVLLIFAMLVAIAWFALIGPKASEISKLQADVVALQAQNATLEARVEELQTLKAQRSILSILANANYARFQLANSDKASAAEALQNTSNTLYQLDLELGPEFDDEIKGLNTRFALIRDGLQSDPDLSSLSDLEVFVDMLSNLLQSILSQ